jgi:hypothetical protein
MNTITTTINQPFDPSHASHWSRRWARVGASMALLRQMKSLLRTEVHLLSPAQDGERQLRDAAVQSSPVQTAQTGANEL